MKKIICALMLWALSVGIAHADETVKHADKLAPDPDGVVVLKRITSGRRYWLNFRTEDGERVLGLAHFKGRVPGQCPAWMARALCLETDTKIIALDADNARRLGDL